MVSQAHGVWCVGKRKEEIPFFSLCPLQNSSALVGEAQMEFVSQRINAWCHFFITISEYSHVLNEILYIWMWGVRVWLINCCLWNMEIIDFLSCSLFACLGSQKQFLLSSHSVWIPCTCEAVYSAMNTIMTHNSSCFWNKHLENLLGAALIQRMAALDC